MSNKPHGVLEDIAGDIGFTATNALADWFGGANVAVPASADESHPICKVIGMPAFRRLVGCFGGTTIWIPFDYQRERDRRDRLIAMLIASGHGGKQIAAVAGMSEAHISQVRKRLEDMGVLPLILRKGGLLSSEESKFTPWQKMRPIPAKKARGKNSV